MSFGISRLLEDGRSLLDQRRLTLAAKAFEEARSLARIPYRRALATYYLGLVYWVGFGDGVAARREFLASVSDFERHGYVKRPDLLSEHAGAVENGMLCALSFEEFEELAAKLRALKPAEPILAGLVPLVREARERGEPWSDQLFLIASGYYNKDRKLDVGRYGEAKSTYHLLLANRRALRLRREDWRIAVFEYCAVAMGLSQNCLKASLGDAFQNSPEEFLPILTDALPLVDEYLAAHPGDEETKRQRDQIAEIVATLREGWAESSKPTPPREMTAKRGMSTVPLFLVLAVLLGALGEKVSSVIGTSTAVAILLSTAGIFYFVAVRYASRFAKPRASTQAGVRGQFSEAKRRRDAIPDLSNVLVSVSLASLVAAIAVWLI
jgi:hypothetical protein